LLSLLLLIDKNSFMQKEAIEGKSILLFDGVCNLCNGFVQFLIKRDRRKQFLYASLQSEEGKELLEAHQLSVDALNTVVLIENGKAYTHSDVALRVSRQLPGLWPLFYGFVILPKGLRDAIYNWIARNRYRWFGKREACMIPTPELKSRFLS
jgi:predicted DCC family thiol-disulfide oxidoreductase YuxK